MQIFFHFFNECMLWGSIPLVLGLEYWEHFLNVSNVSHMIIRIMILGITYCWIWFWEKELVANELKESIKACNPSETIFKKQF